MGRVGAWPLFLSDWRELMPDARTTWTKLRATHTRNEKPWDLHAHASTSTPRFSSRLVRGVLRGVISILSLLLFLIPRRGRPVRAKAMHELHQLAYLDALRGYLALVIFTGHTMPREWRWIPDAVLDIPWLQFPFRGGYASLDIFFWISGYAVTYRIIGLMHAKRPEKLLDALVSSIFRRYFRLFLPTIPVTLLTLVAIKTGVAVPPLSKLASIKGNVFVWWLKDLGYTMNPFKNVLGWWSRGTGAELVGPFWSLSTEFRSSMILFTFCTGVCRMPAHKRRLLILVCIPFFMVWQAQWAAMAFLGMWFAECRQQRVHDQKARHSLVVAQTQTTEHATGVSTPTSLERNSHLSRDDIKHVETGPAQPQSDRLQGRWITLCHRYNLSRFRNPLLYLLFLYSFVVLMNSYDPSEKTLFPSNLLNAITISHWSPSMKMHFHLCVGAFMLLYPLDQLDALQRPLLFPFSQYLGELSFGIYAVHFPVRWVVWEPRYIKWVTKWYREDFDTFSVLFPGFVFMTICVLWAADAFRRFDMQVVRFCKYLETKMFE